jgi:hypothetical protein
MADILAAITVLMVFLTFLLQAIDNQITVQIDAPTPNVSKTIERAKFKKKLRVLLITKSIPITIAFAITSYTLLPKSISIIHHSRFDLWNFDILNTIFIFIELGAIGLTVYSTVKLVQLAKKLFLAS